MRGYNRRRSALTWTIWCGALLVLSGLLAWQFHWLPGSGEPESPVENATADADAPGGRDAHDGDLHRASEPPDPFIADRQSEPGEFSTPDNFRPATQAADDRHADPSSIPQEFPGPDRNGERISEQPPRRFSGTIVGVDGESIPAETYRARNPEQVAGDQPTNRYPQHDRFRGAPTEDRREAHSDGSSSGRSPIRYAGHETEREPRQTSPPATLLAEIDGLRARSEHLAAHKKLSKIYWEKPEWRNGIKSRIEMTAKAVYFDSNVHLLKPYTVQPNERMESIAKKYNISWQYLARLNGMAPTVERAQRLQAGERLKVIKGPFAAAVDLSDRRITIHHYGYYVCDFPVGIGKDGRSPIGKFKVDDKMENPPYTGTDERTGRRYRIAPDDPSNPLGERWISIGDSYGIHGTIDERSIGKAESRGCIRLRNADVEWVYDLLTVGSEVVIQK